MLDAGSGHPLVAANIVLAGTEIGTVSQADGSFFIAGIPPGTRTVVVTFISYEAAEVTAEFAPDETVALAIRLKETIAATLDPVEIRGERPVIDVSRTASSHTLHARDLEELIVQAPTMDQVVAQQPGVTREGGRLHFRGGRADENLFMVDGIKVRDLLSGQSEGTEVDVRSASQVDVATGGFSARYGQAMSGVVDTQLKEGTRRWKGAIRYETDALFDQRSLHLGHFELGGPFVPVAAMLRALGSRDPRVTFYVSLSGDVSNGAAGYVQEKPGGAALNSSIQDRILGYDFGYGTFFYPAATNRWRAVFKTAWKASAHDKFAFTWTKSLGIGHDWGQPDIGDIDRNVSNFPWSWIKNLDGHYTINRDVNILSLVWNRALGLNTSTLVRVWRHYSGTRKDVRGKLYTDYDRDTDQDYRGTPGFEDTPYFVDIGDATDWRDRYVVVWGLANTWNYQLAKHNFEVGLDLEYHDVQYMALNAHSVHIDTTNVDSSQNRPLGDEYDLFHVTPNAGNIYVQDHFEHEGMAVNVGLIYDYWFPGQQVEHAMRDGVMPHMTPELYQKYLDETHSFLGYRFKGHLSPRLGVSFPVSPRSHLFFNYGHYSQRPPYYYVYAKSSSQSGEEYPRIGNPTLNPQISVSYEIGTGYQFNDATAVKATLFWKDMYDYPTSIRVIMKERTTTRSNFFMYWNMDYARSRGIELSLLRRRSDFVSGSVAYTYSVAKGKSSDPNKTKLIQESGGDSREAHLGEEFLWWNRPHKFTCHLTFRVRENERPPRVLGLSLPQDFSIGFYYLLRSGRPYTPINEFGQEVGSAYSLSGPHDTTFDLTITKGYRLLGNRMMFSFNVYNLFDYRTPIVFDHVTGEPYEPGKGSLSQDPADDPSKYAAHLDDVLQSAVDASTGRWIKEYNDNIGHPPSEDEIAAYREYATDALYPSVQGYVDYDYQRSYNQYSNPANFGSPRAFRVGISYEW